MNGIDVVKTSRDPAFAVDAEGRIVAWNQGAEHRLGHWGSEVVGRSCWQVLKCRDHSSEVYCDESCPQREMVSECQAIHPAQMLFGLIDQARMLVRNGTGEETRVKMATFLVQGEAGTREIVHVL